MDEKRTLENEELEKVSGGIMNVPGQDDNNDVETKGEPGKNKRGGDDEPHNVKGQPGNN